jgi:SAM-dependent methyltransferase
MTSASSDHSGGTRPFYGDFAWAYDLLVARPVAEECARVALIFSKRGVPSGARVLDAGCGTGRYAIELARHGYRVIGVDRSSHLIAIARRRSSGFVLADLLALPVRRCHGGILCRGVLNDVLDDDDRGAVMRAFADALDDGGVLVLDVRDWEATVRDKTAEPVLERTVETEHGRLTFHSDTRLEHATRRLLIAERHVLVTDTGTRTESYDFVMRCWTRAELDERLAEAGFVSVQYRGGYDSTVPAGSTDRLVVVASRAPGMLTP